MSGRAPSALWVARATLTTTRTRLDSAVRRGWDHAEISAAHAEHECARLFARQLIRAARVRRSASSVH